MNQDAAIKVAGLGKKYRIGEKPRGYKTLRDSLAAHFARFYKNQAKPETSNNRREFWALHDVSFDVKPGEVVGIIGRNGAGKSTLLKILSRITEPSRGAIDIYGRIGSLLEVGTGFHPELTGRENIFLSGAVLGMKKAETLRQFDEIVAFAEIEEFVETPVKHYSSGMYLRLAFAVAAHLQPNILLVDEVLAVGDVVFQKKCLGKMNDVARQGRTVLFVSHNMSAVQDLCGRGILIDSGQIAYDGEILGCIGEYYKKCSVAESETTSDSNSPLVLSTPQVNSSFTPRVKAGEPFEVSINVSGRELRNPSIVMMIENVNGQRVVSNRIEGSEIGLEVIDGNYSLGVSLPGLWLSPGVYSVYFKFLSYSSNANAPRLFSERLMLEITGETEKTGKAILHPKAEFQVIKTTDKKYFKSLKSLS